jgi:hypothetical protein
MCNQEIADNSDANKYCEFQKNQPSSNKERRQDRVCVCELQNVAGGVSYVRCTKTAAGNSRERKTATNKSGSREVQSLNLRAQNH